MTGIESRLKQVYLLQFSVHTIWDSAGDDITIILSIIAITQMSHVFVITAIFHTITLQYQT